MDEMVVVVFFLSNKMNKNTQYFNAKTNKFPCVQSHIESVNMLLNQNWPFARVTVHTSGYFNSEGYTVENIVFPTFLHALQLTVQRAAWLVSMERVRAF